MTAVSNSGTTNMSWLNCGVTTQAEWPEKRKDVKYGDHTFVLLPPTKESSASIHIELKSINGVEEQTLINRFLSVLAWKCDQPAINHYGWSGSAEPMPVPKHRIPFGYSPFAHFPGEISEITDKKTKLAIALYREARSLDSVPFKFLSYFKILNIFWKDNELVEGLRSALRAIENKDCKQRIEEIEKLNGDAASYLYKSGRCAVAHAHTNPIVDPDDVTDLHRLSKDLWLMQNLTAFLIEKEFKITQSIWSQEK
jgi:hypothetical protein